MAAWVAVPELSGHGQQHQHTLGGSALHAAQGLAPESRHEVAGKKVLAKVTGSKNAELEQLEAELAAAQQEAEAQRTRAEGAVSRCGAPNHGAPMLPTVAASVLWGNLWAALSFGCQLVRRAGARSWRPSCLASRKRWPWC